VAISTAIWAAVGMWLGATVGEAIGNVLFDRGWIYLLGLLLLIVVVAVSLVVAWRRWSLSRAVSA
jgi:membrane protein DedA with SNARE-associated domain